MQVIELESSIIRGSYVENKISKVYTPYQLLRIDFNFERKSFTEYFLVFNGYSLYDSDKKSSKLLKYRYVFITEVERELNVQLFFGINDKNYSVAFKLINNPNYNEKSSKSPNYILKNFRKTLQERLEEIPEYKKIATEIGKRDSSLEKIKRSRGK